MLDSFQAQRKASCWPRAPQNVKSKGGEQDDCSYVATERFQCLNFMLLQHLSDQVIKHKKMAEAELQEEERRCLCSEWQ